MRRIWGGEPCASRALHKKMRRIPQSDKRNCHTRHALVPVPRALEARANGHSLDDVFTAHIKRDFCCQDLPHLAIVKVCKSGQTRTRLSD
jgi:hypothetical protein